LGIVTSAALKEDMDLESASFDMRVSPRLESRLGVKDSGTLSEPLPSYCECLDDELELLILLRSRSRPGSDDLNDELDLTLVSSDSILLPLLAARLGGVIRITAREPLVGGDFTVELDVEFDLTLLLLK
jgi:hypothetical protein